LLNSFNNYIHKMISLNSLTTILAILFGHYSQNDTIGVLGHPVRVPPDQQVVLKDG